VASVITGRADAVLGQSDFSHGFVQGRGCPGPLGTLTSARALCAPRFLTLARSGRLYVSDSDNNRVLSWPDAYTFANGQAADVVLGQPNLTEAACVQPPTARTLCEPLGLAVDVDNRLYVSDSNNHRVLRFPTPTSTFSAADLVLGQPDFAGHACGNPPFNPDRARSLCVPQALALDHRGELYVVDSLNFRVLHFDPPLRTGQAADLVIGQPDPGHVDQPFPPGPNQGARRLSRPTGVALDRLRRVYIVDSDSHRVLRFEPLHTNFPSADLVLGRTDFAPFQPGCVFNGQVATAANFCFPEDVAVGHHGRVYIADSGNSRIMRFTRPRVSGQRADVIIGQPTPNADDCNTGGISRGSLCFAFGVATGRQGSLFVADTGNDRVLRFNGSPPDADEDHAEDEDGPGN
jgi:sugar lactone lactonase YvrE